MFPEDATAFLSTAEHASEVILLPGQEGETPIDAIFNEEGVEWGRSDGVIMVTDKPMIIAATADLGSLAQKDNLSVGGTTHRVFDIEKMDVTFSIVWLMKGAA